MLVEDEDRLRTIVTMMLEELGAEVVSAEDGERAIQEYDRCPDEIDLVLLDVRMSGLSGVTTLKRLRESHGDVKAILSSGVLPEESVVEEIASNGGSFLEKPFNLAQLSTAIVRTLTGESVIWTL